MGQQVVRQQARRALALQRVLDAVEVGEGGTDVLGHEGAQLGEPCFQGVLFDHGFSVRAGRVPVARFGHPRLDRFPGGRAAFVVRPCG
ncbi:hypothetical protein [Streptomyces sp. C]|uniref:hypothetical protein n=1 Tax=Streptomyces sp. C TaxID=253839 RepID=UPI00101B5371|nr:hypothetical protein [Streptomyces sp. C]